MIPFCGVLLAHLLYDLHWQGPFVSEMKSKSPFFLVIHTLTWTLLVSAVLYYFQMHTLWKLVFLFATHLAIDGWRVRFSRLPPMGAGLVLDQLLHLLTLIVVVA